MPVLVAIPRSTILHLLAHPGREDLALVLTRRYPRGTLLIGAGNHLLGAAPLC